MVRNLLAILAGLTVAMILITFGITLNQNWLPYEGELPYEHWRQVIKNANKSGPQIDLFFVALLTSCGVGALVGGLLTAAIVKNAKQAYAVFLGFILFVIAYLDIIFTPYHPTWYELGVMPILFFFSWLGGKITDLLMKVFSKSG